MSNKGFAALAILLFAISAAPRASSATSDAACALVTQAQVSAAIGISVEAGTHPTPTFMKTCTWNASGAAAKEVKYVTISFQNAASYESGKRLMHQTQAAMNQKEGSAGMANDSASGIGDDAYYTTMGTGYTGLMVKKGDVGLKIAIYGSIPSAKRKRRENPCRRSFIQALISAQQFN